MNVSNHSQTNPFPQQSNPDFLTAANTIAAKLCRDAFWAGDRCTWLGSAMELIDHNWLIVYRTATVHLYDGTSGIALFLGRLFQQSPERLYQFTALAAMKQALSQLDDIPPTLQIGFYSGKLGIAYVLLELGEQFGQSNWLRKAWDIVTGFLSLDFTQQGLDVVSGAAGAIAGLLAIYRNHPQDVLLDLSQQLADHLVNTAQREDEGWSWDTLNVPAQRHLTGFSHGTAGIAWALLELAKITGKTQYRQVAEHAFAYERHWYNPECENWLDLRNFNNSHLETGHSMAYGVAWCHGAPGIALSRLRAYQHWGETISRAEAEAALRTTLKSVTQVSEGGWDNYSLCHGLGGNADVLLSAGQILANPTYYAIASQVGQRGLTTFANPRLPWTCGVPGGGETPSLMLGLAGIGYFYLRLYAPEKFPSVLMILE